MSNELVYVSSIEEVHSLNLRTNDKISYVCCKCGKVQVQKFCNVNKKNRLICAHCLQVEVKLANPNIKESYNKARQTLLNTLHSGKSEYYNKVHSQRIERLEKERKSKEFNKHLREINKQIKAAHAEAGIKEKKKKEKIEYTCVSCGKKFFGYHPEKRRFSEDGCTCNSCHVKFFNKDPDIIKRKKESIIKTSMERYGVPAPFMAKENQEKLRQSNLKKYGVENAFQRKDVQEKIKQTNLEKYGAASYNQSEYRSKNGFNSFLKKYKYNDLYFDSSWELAFYIYCIDHSIKIAKEIEKFTYIHNGRSYSYFPDFTLSCGRVEIKGSHLIANDGTWKNPYAKVDDGHFEAKHQCALKNNVTILTEKEIKPFIQYVKNEYGKDFIKKCQVHRSSYMSEEKHQKRKQDLELLSKEYKNYKDEGGVMSWNEFQRKKSAS